MFYSQGIFMSYGELIIGFLLSITLGGLIFWSAAIVWFVRRILGK